MFKLGGYIIIGHGHLGKVGPLRLGHLSRTSNKIASNFGWVIYVCLNWVAMVNIGHDHLAKIGPGDGRSL